MSFQRDLTGSSNLYATVNLNTNVCANSVSTVNLSATNASFTNITTNTWTTGNVSTPNVIATNGYFSILNTCSFGVCSLTTSSIYSSNASFDNVSIATKLTVTNISSIRNLFSNQVVTMYPSGGVIIRDNNQSNSGLLQLNYASTAVIDTYGMILEAKKSGTGGYSRVTAGQNLSFEVYADNVKQADNTSTAGWTFYSSVNSSRANFSNLSSGNVSVGNITVGNELYHFGGGGVIAYETYTTNGTGTGAVFYNTLDTRTARHRFQYMGQDVMSLNSSQIIAYNPINTSYAVNASLGNICNLSSNTIQVGTLNTSALNSSALNISSLSTSVIYTNYLNDVAEISTGTPLRIMMDRLTIRDIANASTNICFNYDDATFTDTTGMTFEIGQAGVNVSVQGALPFTLYNGGIKQLTNISNYGFSIHTSVYASYISVSSICVNDMVVRKTLTSVSVNATSGNITDLYSFYFSAQLANISGLTGVSAKYTSMSCSNLFVSSMAVSNFSANNISIANNLDVGANINCDKIYTSRTYASNMTIDNRIDAARIVLTNSFDSPITNVSDARVSTIKGVSSSFSYLDVSTINIPVFNTSNINVSISNICNLSSSYISAELFSCVSTAITDMFSTNVVTVMTSTSYLSSKAFDSLAANISNISLNNASINNLTVTSLNFSNTSIANISITGSLTATSGTITTFNSTSATIGTITTSTVAASFVDVDGTVYGTDGKFQNWELQNSAGNALYTVTNNGFRVIHNVENTGVTEVNFNRLNASLMKMTTSQIFLYNPTFINTSIHASQGNFSNSTIATLNATSAFVSNLSVSNFSVATAMTATSGTLTTLNATSAFVSNLSASNISVPGRISVSNISATSISATGRINGDTIRATTDIQCATGTISGGTGQFVLINTSNIYVSNNFSCANVSSTQVSSTSIATSFLNASNMSVINASITTLTGTTFSASTGNFSTVAISSIVNLSVSSLWTSSLVIATTNGASTFGSLDYAANRLSLFSLGNASRLSLGNNGNVRFEVSVSGVSSYVPFFTSTGNASIQNACTLNATTGNLSTLNVSNLNATNFNPATINTSTLNASTMNVCNFNPATITTSTVNACMINSSNMSGIINIFSSQSMNLYNDGLYFNSAYASVGGIPYMQFNYWKTSISAPDQGFTMFADETRGSVIDGGNLPLVIRSSDFAQATNSSTSGWLFQNKINTSFQTNISKLAVSNMSMTGIANISTLYVSNSSMINLSLASLTSDSGKIINFSSSYVSITNLSVTSITIPTIDNTSITNLSVTTALTIPNTIPANISNISLKIHASSINTQAAGIQVPNYIDGLDTTLGLFIGYNHSAGFVNFNRPIRSFTNIQLDGNLNQITTTNDLGIGRNVTTGNILIGDTAMTGNISINTSGNIVLGNISMGGNISIDTAGDVVFGCDRRSLWNTSGLIKCSSQLGSFYSFTTGTNTFTKTSTGQTLQYHPYSNNISLTPFPVGLYLVTGNAYIQTQGNVSGNFNGVVTGLVAGIAVGTTQPSGNTARIQYFNSGALPALTNTSGVVVPVSWSGVYNLTVTNQYITMYIGVTCASAVTAGLLFGSQGAISVTKIA